MDNYHQKRARNSQINLKRQTVASFPNSKSSPLLKIQSDFLRSRDDRVLVCAHRGLMKPPVGDGIIYPENSLSAIKDSIEKGADVLELDVQMTSDGHLVLMHDATIDRTTNGSGLVSDLTLEEVRGLRLKVKRNGSEEFAGGGEGVPTLEEAVRLCRHRCMVALDKVWLDVIDECARVIDAQSMHDQVIYIGYYGIQERLEYFDGVEHSSNYMHVIKSKGAQGSAELWQMLAPFLDIDAASSCMMHFVLRNEDDPVLTSEILTELRERGVSVWCNTLWDSHCDGHSDEIALVDPDRAWGWLIDKGVNVIQTDHGEQLLEYLRAKGLHE